MNTKSKKFYDKLDPDFKKSGKELERIEKRIGWKSLFLFIQEYQREMHPNDGYNFNQVKL